MQFSPILFAERLVGDEISDDSVESRNMHRGSGHQQYYSTPRLVVVPKEYPLGRKDLCVSPHFMPDAKIPSLPALVFAGLIQVLVIPPHIILLDRRSLPATKRDLKLALPSQG